MWIVSNRFRVKTGKTRHKTSVSICADIFHSARRSPARRSRPTFGGDGGDECPVEVQDDVDDRSRLQLVGRHDAHEVAIERLLAEILARRRVADLRYVEQRQQVLHLHTTGQRTKYLPGTPGWRFSAVVTSFVARTKLLNVEPG